MFGVNWSDPQTLWLKRYEPGFGNRDLAAVLTVIGAVGWELGVPAPARGPGRGRRRGAAFDLWPPSHRISWKCPASG
jgi:hypothetical protein